MVRSDLARWLVLATAVLMTAPMAGAFHLYRSTDVGCTDADGPTGGRPTAGGAQVLVLHNTFLDLATGLPVTHINAGQSVTWTWASAHCHSVTSGTPGSSDGAYSSGFHYPLTAPPTPQAVPGFLEYPVFELGAIGPVDTGTPTYSWTATSFDLPGTYLYFCVHHYYIGMVGVVVVS